MAGSDGWMARRPWDGRKVEIMEALVWLDAKEALEWLNAMEALGWLEAMEVLGRPEGVDYGGLGG